MNPLIVHVADLALAVVAATAGDSISLDVGQDDSGSTGEASTVKTLSIAELIAALPEGPEERVFDRHRREYDIHPVAEELKWRMTAGPTLSDEEWRRALLRSGAIRYRQRWPDSMPVAISMREPYWLSSARITMTPRREDLAAAEAGFLTSLRCGTYAMSSTTNALYQEVGMLASGEHLLTFDVAIERRERGHWREPPVTLTLWRGSITFEMEVGGSIDDVLPPVSGPGIDEAVRDSIGILFKDWNREGTVGGATARTAILVLDPDTGTYPELARTALSLTVELLRGETVVGTADLLASDYDPLRLMCCTTLASRRYFAFRRMLELPPEIESDSSGASEWSLRIRGTNNSVQAIWNADQHWAGSLRIPVDEAMDQERQRAPGRRWSYFPARF